MSYTPTTRLARREPVEPPENIEDGAVDLSVYNEVEIIGHSPVQRGVRAAEWTGQQGDLYSVKPITGFGEIIEVAQGQLEKDYEATFIPELSAPAEIQVTRIKQAGPSPEQRFKQLEAEGHREQDAS
jgi:hypothetical protein